MKFKPDLTGPMGMAWKVDFEHIRRTHGNRPDGGVVGWYVSAPWAHPVWHTYGIDCIHLRDVPGFPPSVIRLPGATHEVLVGAIDPAWQLDPREKPAFLQPMNFVGQFICTDDEAARLTIETTVKEIINGHLNPDTDAIQQWIDRFGDNSLKKDVPRTGDAIVIVGDKAIVKGTGAAIMRAITGPQKPPHEGN